MKIPSVMKAALLMGHGDVSQLSVRDDVPIPELNANEVLVQVGACSISNGDVWIREGAYGLNSNPNARAGWRRDAFIFPRIQGVNISGRIVRLGASVPIHRLGERVIVNPVVYTSSDESLADAKLIGSEFDGGYAEFVAIPTENAHGVRSSMSYVELATFPSAYLTAERMLNRGRVGAGEKLLVTGGSGGLGSALIQLALLRGARVAAIVGNAKVRMVQTLGCAVIGHRDPPDLEGEMLRAFGDPLVDVVADVVGGPTLSKFLSILRPGGRLVTAGAIANPLVQLDLRTIYLGHLEIIGSSIGTRKDFEGVVSYINQDFLKPLVGGVYQLANIRQAHQDFKLKKFFGRLVISVSDCLEQL